jgi:hypothetical protein
MLKQMPAIWRRALERRQEETEWDRCALAAFRGTVRAHREIAERRGNNKRFGVMHDQGIEKSARAFHDGFVALDEVQDVDGTACEMQGAAAKPMAARFDEFKFV